MLLRAKQETFAVSTPVVNLVREVEKHILTYPTQFDMGLVYQADHPHWGSVACIAGWTAIIARKLRPREDGTYSLTKEKMLSIATRSLGLGNDWNDGLRLFAVYCWPEPFKSHFILEETRNLQSPASRLRLTKIAVRRLEHFVHVGE